MLIAKRFLPSLTVALSLLASACGASQPGSSSSGALAVQPATSSIAPGDTVLFSALFEGVPGTQVAWSVKEPSGGTIAADGTYVAPTEEGTYTVLASTGVVGEVAQAVVVVAHRDAATVTITIKPRAASIAAGAMLPLAATVTGVSATAVTWSVEEGPSGGTITSAGLYSAPVTSGTYHVVARSVAAPSVSDRASITVTAPPPPAGPQLYVATSGNDGNPGSEAQPWRTIQKAMNSATAGSTVNIKAGSYPERLTLNVSGAEGKPITFQPYGFSGAPGCGGRTGVRCGGDAVVLDYRSLGTVVDGVPFLRISGRNHVRIQGLTFQNFSCNGGMQQGVRIDGDSSFVELRHNRFLNNQNTHQAIDFTAALLHLRVWGPAHDVTISGNEFANIVTVVSETLTIDQGAHDVVIEGNWLHDVDGIAIDTHGGAHHVTVRNNLLERIGKKGDGSFWYDNPPNAIYNDGGNNVRIERNTVRDSAYAIAVVSEPDQPAGHDILIRDNLCHGNAQAGIMVGNWYSTDGSKLYNIRVLNNTLAGNGFGYVLRPFQGSTVVWKGNILAGNGTNIYNGLGSDPGTMDYNLYWGNGGAGPDAHKVVADPRFTNAGGGDYSLQAGSPAIDAGDPAAAPADVGDQDVAGNVRIVNGRVDIGALEKQ